MNILIAVSDLHVGGAQTLVLSLANQLATRHQVHLYNYNLFRLRPQPLNPQLADSVQLYSLPWWLVILPDKTYWLLEKLGISRRRFTWVNRLRHWHLRSILRRHSIDIVSTHLFDADDFISTTLAKSAIQFVVTDHGDYQYLQQRLSHRQTIQNILARASAVVYIAERNATVLQQTAAASKLSKIYNGISPKTKNFDLKAHLALPSDAFVFGMVARGIPEKGWAEAIQGLEKVYHQAKQSPQCKKVHLILIGDSAYLKQLKQQVSPALQKVVHFVGYADRPLDWIQGFDVGLLPSYFAGESLPMAIAEYLSQKKPVIATDLGGIAEMLNDGEHIAGTLLSLSATGRVAPSELAHAMQHYMQSPQSVKQQASSAAFIFQKKFNIQACAAAYESLFEQVIAS